MHDKFEDDRDSKAPRNSSSDRNLIATQPADLSEALEIETWTNTLQKQKRTLPCSFLTWWLTPPTRPRSGAKLRVDNLHYDLTEEDLEVRHIRNPLSSPRLTTLSKQDLFTRIGPILSISLRYDRAGRSDGTAFVTYELLSDARLAIREFDGANAKGLPIRLTLLPTAPAKPTITRNPFDTAQKPSRSLFDRIEAPKGRTRSASPDRPRPTDTTKPAPEGIDRYVPGQRSRSPPPRRSRDDRDRGSGRRPGARREDSGPGRGRGRGRGEGRGTANGRPRKTQEELDAEMEDYWGAKGNDKAEVKAGVQNASVGGNNDDAGGETVFDDGDIEMIE